MASNMNAKSPFFCISYVFIYKSVSTENSKFFIPPDKGSSHFNSNYPYTSEPFYNNRMYSSHLANIQNGRFV